MMRDDVEAAQVVLSCRAIDPTLAFLTDLGFVVDTVFPADDPAVVVVSGYGVRLRLQRADEDRGPTLRLRACDLAARAGGRTELTAPNGTRIELASPVTDAVVPPLSPTFGLTRAGTHARWIVGRAGMHYRDLVPDRQGGFAVASHIRIPAGGPVPDYVHYHRVRFQMIFCHRGWVKLVYEDQGEPFVMQAGDCVLLPPQIRHRVLESAAGLEVIEVGVPALHETLADHALALPTATERPDRDFDGQRFVWHRAAQAPWRPWRRVGFEARDTGIAAATSGLADVKIARVCGALSAETAAHDVGFQLGVVLQGAGSLVADDQTQAVGEGDAFVVPPHHAHALFDCTPDFELLEVTIRQA